jgi:L-serine dehydratase
MRAARSFAVALDTACLLDSVVHVQVALFGSLAATGLGHGTPDAVVAGLAGLEPETCAPEAVRGAWSNHTPGTPLLLLGRHEVPFTPADLAFDPRVQHPEHPNALTLQAWCSATTVKPTFEQTYLSVGGGFIRLAGEPAADVPASGRPGPVAARTGALADGAYWTMAGILALCDRTGSTIADIARSAEHAWHTDEDLDRRLDAIWQAMRDCVQAGMSQHGLLPGDLQVRRRAAVLAERLGKSSDPHDHAIDWLHAFALAVNEENAAGGRVVTAPTNGAAGIIPAVLHYYDRFVPGASQAGVRTFLLTATVIGSLMKANASISGAVGGCQAEVGAACAMAAGGLCAVLGGEPHQVENAAEIALEHHLGLTCDPVLGLVQIPCIERNAIAATTAVAAARLALHGDGSHLVSLDTVIETMRQTGADMSVKYKETSQGGLAVNVVEC